MRSTSAGRSSGTSDRADPPLPDRAHQRSDEAAREGPTVGDEYPFYLLDEAIEVMTQEQLARVIARYFRAARSG